MLRSQFVCYEFYGNTSVNKHNDCKRNTVEMQTVDFNGVLFFLRLSILRFNGALFSKLAQRTENYVLYYMQVCQ